MVRKILFFTGLCMCIAANAVASITTETVEYTAKDGVTMEGYVAYDDAITTARPAILIVHDWMGLAPFDKDKAELLAKQGYVAMAVDVYGKGARPANTEEAKKLATKYKDNRALLRSHMQAAYDRLIAMKAVDNKKIVVMGYCFGGTAALELARNGAPLVGTVTFHGGLSNPTAADAKNIKGRVLVLHGANDPFVPPAEVQAFRTEMRNAGVDTTIIFYPGAVHAFTNPAAGNDNSKGAAYNAVADKASWEAFEQFLKAVSH